MPHPFCGEAYSKRGWGRELLDGRSGGVRDILNRQVGGRDGDVAGLSVVELLEEVCGDDGVVFMVGRCWGVVGRVRVSGHSSAVENTEGVAAKGSVGVTMLDGGGGLLSGPSTLLLCWGWLGRCVEVPRWGGQVPEGGWGVKGVVAASLICG